MLNVIRQRPRCVAASNMKEETIYVKCEIACIAIAPSHVLDGLAVERGA